MNKYLKYVLVTALVLTLSIQSSYGIAGNPDRAGQAGGTQLLINPWGRSSGLGGTNMASMSGVESVNFNIGGAVNTNGTEFAVSRSLWLGGAVGMSVNSFGLVAHVGGSRDSFGRKRNALTFSINSLDIGSIQVTTEGQPAGNGSFYSPSFTNLSIGFSHAFSNNISGGFVFKTISEGITNARASGFAIDAGIMYKGGDNDRARFGVALRNVGPALTVRGDGLSSRGVLEGYDYSMTIERRPSPYEMPSVLNIAASYDILTNTNNIPKKIRNPKDSTPLAVTSVDNRFKPVLSVSAAFTSNAFSQDQIGVGLEFTPISIFQVRAGYVYEKNIFKADSRTFAYSGPSAGFSVNFLFGKEKQRLFGLDYSIRAAKPFSATHTFGLRLNI
ncbi:MAG: PorV/PorQ family protein [Bacteroidota bacterium]|nr:PorV/PorQ family protein [Bacteroidota bacterium]